MTQAGDSSTATPAAGWQVHEPSGAELRDRLCREAGLHPLVAAILVRRGVATAEAAQRFLRPTLAHLHPPFALKGMAEAAAAVTAAIEDGTRIVVSGDYDVDGITSSAMLTHFLRAAGARALDTFIPNRFAHGYGLTARSVDALLALKPGLVVTVDNGITAVAEVERLRAAGVATVITDHHLPRQEGVPPGIVVNPLQPGCAYPFKKLSGCGVTLKLMMALRERLRDKGWWGPARPEPNLKDYLDLVAIGTIADVVPLVDENRVLARAGLEVLNRVQRRPGIQALLSVARVEKAVTARTIGFQIAPRINAAGRMADASLAVELLLAQDAPRALELAALLEQENDNRRAKGNEMFKEAMTRIETENLAAGAGIVVMSPAFHEGIIGIIAARLVEHYRRPVVVLAENGRHYKGSARSVPGLNVTEAMTACAGLLAEFGGHAGAAGCHFLKQNLPEFRARFVAACARLGEHTALPALWLEGRLGPAELAPRALTDLAGQIAQLEPFGQDHEEPAFLVNSADLPGAPATMGKDQSHLKWTLSAQAEVVGWSLADRLPLPSGAQLSVRFGFNEYRGTRKVQLTVDGVRG